jgi:hypothetical protein
MLLGFIVFATFVVMGRLTMIVRSRLMLAGSSLVLLGRLVLCFYWHVDVLLKNIPTGMSEIPNFRHKKRILQMAQTGPSFAPRRSKKKPTLRNAFEAFHGVGLLFNEPLGFTEVPFF